MTTSENFDRFIVDSNDKRRSVTLEVIRLSDQQFQIRVTTEDQEWIEIGVDQFQALLAVRRQLDRDGLKILVQGARKFVWPMGLSGQWSDGRVAADRTGGPDADWPMVDIFEPTESQDVVSANEQEDSIVYPELSPELNARIDQVDREMQALAKEKWGWEQPPQE